MKLKLSILASAAALLTATPASADFTVRLTGSTAFRSSTVTAIKNLMTFAGGGAEGYAYTGTSFTGSNNHIFVGKMTAFGSQIVTVKCTWSGAVAGVRALNSNVNVSFLALHPGVTDGAGTQYALTTTGTSGVNTNNLDDITIADLAMTDNLQASTNYTNNPLDAERVGIIPFAFVAGRDAPAGLTNISPQLAQTLWTTGFCSAALFTNNAADASDIAGGTMVYPIGRDPFSGTRLVTFAESGIGVKTEVLQWRRTALDAVASPNQGVASIDLTLEDLVTDPAFPISAGNNGETSGGTVADNLRYKTTAVNDLATGHNPVKATFIGYVGESDANRAVNGIGTTVNGANTDVGCRYLKYNGVNAFGGVVYSTSTATTTIGSPVVTNLVTTGLIPGQLVRSTTGQLQGDSVILSVDSGTQVTLTKNATASATATAQFGTSNLLPDAIWNGSYTFWGYEYIMKRSSLTSGSVFTFFGLLKTQIHDIDYFSAGLSEASMRVGRSSDGGTVGASYDFAP